MEGEEAFFSFRLPDYRGMIGVEFGFDKALRGMAGAKSVLVNNAGYRQTENIWSPAEPGSNVVLTIDLPIQQAAEHALQVFGPGTRGAVVVMDVRNGDILTMASSPTFNPNSFLPSLSHADAQRIAELQAEKNRATQENYPPGSIFKPIVGLACLEAGLDPNSTMHNPGYIDIGRRPIADLAPDGDYNFRRASEGILQHLLHHQRPARGRDLQHREARPALASWRTGGPAHPPGDTRHLPEPQEVGSGWYRW